MARQTIKQRIALDGAKEIEAELKELGKVGEEAFKKLQQAAGKVKIADNFTTQLNRMQEQLKQAAKKFNQVGREIEQVGRRISLFITAPLLAAGGAALRLAGDFESSMNAFVANTGVATKELEAAKDMALELGSASVFSASEAADAMTELAKVGLNYEQIMEGAAKATVTLAAANGAELAPSALLVGDVINQFKLDVQELPAIIDNITGGLVKSKLDFDNYRLAIGQAGGVAGALGVQFEEFNAVLAATSPLFASGSDAGTSFKTFLLRLTPSTKKAAALMKEFNLTFFDAQGQFLGLANAAEELQTKLGHLSDEQRNLVFGELFGQDAIRTALALMEQGGEGVERFMREIGNTNSLELAEVRMRGFNGALKQLTDAFEVLAIEIGDSGFLQTMTELVQMLTEFIRELAKADPELLNFAVKVAAIAAAIGPVLIAIGLISQGIAGLITGFRGVIAVISLVGLALTRLGFLFVANPWLAAIAAIAGGILTWVANTDTASAALSRHEQIVDDLTKAYAEAGFEVAKMTKEVKDRLFVETIASLEKTKDGLSSAIDDLRQQLLVLSQQEGIGPIIKQFDEANPSVKKLIDQLAEFGRLHPEFAFDVDEILKWTTEAEKLEKAVNRNNNIIDLLTGKMSDAEFKARELDGIVIEPKANPKPVEDLGTAAENTQTKVENLGKAITVTAFGEGDPTKKSFELIDGIAQKAVEAEEALDKVGKKSEETTEKVKVASEGIQLLVRSVPEAMKSDAATAAVDGVIEDVQRIIPAAQQVATETNAALTQIGAIDPDQAQAAADAVVAPFRGIQQQIAEIFAAIQSLVQTGFQSLATTINNIALQIQATINRILAQLRQAAAEAARLRAQASAGDGLGGPELAGGGGPLRGRGTSTSDSIPAWLSVGEFVTRAKAVSYYGPELFRALNSLRLPKDFFKRIRGFSMGGLAGSINRSIASISPAPMKLAMGSIAPVQSGVSGRPFIFKWQDGESFQFIDPDDVTEKFVRSAQRRAVRSAGKKPDWFAR